MTISLGNVSLIKYVEVVLEKYKNICFLADTSHVYIHANNS